MTPFREGLPLLACLAASSGCVRTYFDADLRPQRIAQPAALRENAPAFEYELLVATAADRPLPHEDGSSLADRAQIELDDLLKAHGVRPIRHEPGTSGPYVHLTLIRGPRRTMLWAERRTGDASSARRSYDGPSDPVRPELDALLGKMLIDFVPPAPAR